MTEHSAEIDQKWEAVQTGLRAHLWITCPSCGDDSDYIEFDADDLRGATQVTADCPDCGQQITAYLDALVQRVITPAGSDQ